MKKLILIMVLLLSAGLLTTLCAGCGAQSMEAGQAQDGEGTLPALRNGDTSPVNLYPAAVSYLGNPKWGYINNSGKFVLQPVYSSAERFQTNGLAVAGKNERVGLINTKGEFVAEPVYQNIGEFSEGLAVAQDETGFSVMDAKGDIISGKYPFIGQYKEGRAPFYISMQDGSIRYGYLGENGQPAVKPVYKYVTDFDGDAAVVQLQENSFGIIDRNGNMLKTLKYNFVMGISDGMIAFKPTQDSKNGYLNSKGDVAIDPQFLITEAFRDEAAVVDASADFTVNRFGLIDKKGKYLIRPQYNDILQLGEGMAAPGLAIDPKMMFAGSRYALATREGTTLTDFIFYGLEQFHNGVASVYDNTSTWFIDKQGKRVESLPSAEGIGKLELLDSLVYADIDRRPYYMNKKGGIVYRPSSTIALKSGAKVTEEKFRPNRNYLVYYPVLSDLKDLKVQESINIRLRDMWIDKKITPTDNLDYSYEGDFKIGFNRKNLLELQKSAYDFPFGAAHGMPVMEYVHIDTRTGVFYELGDLFRNGSGYVKVLSDIVGQQIKEHGKEMGVWPDSYKGIRPDQPFYISSSGDALMLYFEPYEIAPYAAGFPTFRIPFAEISGIIDKNGNFWLSFN